MSLTLRSLSRPVVLPVCRILFAAAVIGAVFLAGSGRAWAKYDPDSRATLIVKDQTPGAVLRSLAEQLAIMPPPEYRGDPAKKVTLNIKEVTFQEAMDQIARVTGQAWWRTNDDRYVIGDMKAYEEAKAKGEMAKDRVPAEAKPAVAAAEKAAPGPIAEKSPASAGVGADAAPEDVAAPAATTEEEPKATLVFNQGKIEQVLMALGQQTGVRISPEGKTAGLRVDVIAKDQPLTEILDTIANPKGLVWWKKPDGSYGIADKAYYEQTVLPGQAIQRIFRPNHIKAEDFEKAIKGVLTPKIGKAAVDPRTNKVIVTDLPPVVEMIERLLQEIDVQLVTRVFQVHYADVEEIAKQIEDYKSGPGTIKVDPKTHQIVVTDLLQNILRMEKLLDVLDIGPEIVVYDVNNVGLDGEALEDLKGIIDSVRTKDLLFETNDMQGTFILEDVPEVHDKVEKILKAFDQPVKQVQIEAEILTTSVTRNFSYGIDWTYSENLFGAAADGLVTLPGKPTGNTAIDGGYRDLGQEFPIMTNSGGTGFAISNLSKEALITLSLAMNDKSTNVLSQPQLFVKNQESARINVGKDEPYLTTFNNYNNNNNYYGGQSTTQNYVNAGLNLEITPSISNNGLVEMEISVQDNDASPFTFAAGGNTGNVILVRKDTKEIDTVLVIPTGETRMLGGLLKDSKSKNKEGIPLLSDIPIIGPLFGKYSKDDSKSNLMIFMTPTIIEEHGTVKVTQEGRRGRALTLDESAGDEDATSPTLKNTALESSDETESGSLNQGATLSGDTAESQVSYLLGHEEAATDEETPGTKGPRTSSYSSTVGSPVGALTDVSGAVTTSSSSEPGPSEPSEGERPVAPPRGGNRPGPPPIVPPQDQASATPAAQPTAAPSTSETDY